jgi:hypothetical protein
MGFVKHLRKFMWREGRLEKVHASIDGTYYKYLLEFTPGYPRGERVILKEVRANSVLIEYVETKEQKEILVEQIQLAEPK